MIDAFIVLSIIFAASSFGMFPLNSYLAALASSLGQALLALTLRSRTHAAAFNSSAAATLPVRAFGEFLGASAALHTLVALLLM